MTETVDPQMCTLCIGNLPTLMHAKLETELRKFFRACEIMKIFLLENYQFCFIRFKTPNAASEAVGIIKTQAFCGKVLRFEKHAPETYVPYVRDVIAEIYQNLNEGQPMAQPSQSAEVGTAARSQMPYVEMMQHNEPIDCVTAKVKPTLSYPYDLQASKPAPTKDYILEVLDLPNGISNTEFFLFCQPFGALSTQLRGTVCRITVSKERREELYTAMDQANFRGRQIRCRYPPYDGPKSKKYKEDETCRIIVEGVSDPDHKEVSRLLPLRFEAFGKVSGCEILRNRAPSCAFIDIERNIAEVAVSNVDGEFFFGEAIQVALMKQDDVIVIDSEDEGMNLERDSEGRVKNKQKKPTILPSNNLLPSNITIPSPNNVNKVVELMCERQRLEVLHPYEEYLLQMAPPEGSAGLDDAEPLPNPPQQFIRLLMDRALCRVKLTKLANASNQN